MSETPKTDAARECLKQELGNRQASPATAFALRTMHDLETALAAAQEREKAAEPRRPCIESGRRLKDALTALSGATHD